MCVSNQNNIKIILRKFWKVINIVCHTVVHSSLVKLNMLQLIITIMERALCDWHKEEQYSYISLDRKYRDS